MSKLDLSRFCFNKNRRVVGTRITDDDTENYCQVKQSRKPVIQESDDESEGEAGCSGDSSGIKDDDSLLINYNQTKKDTNCIGSGELDCGKDSEISDEAHYNIEDSSANSMTDEIGMLLHDSYYDSVELEANIVKLKKQFPDIDEIDLQDVLIDCQNKFDAAVDKIKSSFFSSLAEKTHTPRPAQGKENKRGGVYTGRWITMSGENNQSVSTKPRKSRIKRPILSSDDEDEIVVVSSKFKNTNPTAKSKQNKSLKAPYKKIRSIALSDSEESDQEKDKMVTLDDSEDDEDYDEKDESEDDDVGDDGAVEEENFFATSSDEDTPVVGEENAPPVPEIDDEEEDYDDIIGESSEEDEEEETATTTAPNPSPVDAGKLALRTKVLSYLNDATENDLLDVPNVSKKKAQIIMSLRPFINWMDLVTKIKCDRLLTLDLIVDCKEIIKSYDSISRLMSECEKISKKISDTVEHLEPLTQPNILNKDLKLTNYQLIGLNWLVLLYNKSINGILADEMGLGKTIQVIALLAYLRENVNVKGPHLIVVPSSTLDNWQREFETWCPACRIVIYHGSMENRAQIRANIGARRLKYDVLLTTYNLVGSPDDKKFLKRTLFCYIVFDEAHMLKNMKSNRFSNLISLRAQHRLLLTGTPVQNNLLELMSLLFFTMPSFFSSKLTHIQNLFASKRRSGETTFEKEKVEQAKRIIRPFILRRLKANVLRQLPTKTEHVKLCPMTNEQEMVYMELIENCAREIRYNGKNIFESEEFEDMAPKPKKGSAMLMELRKAANHPLLLRRHYDDSKLSEMAKLMLKEPTHSDANVNYIFEDMQVMTDFELHKLCCKYKSLADYKLSRDLIITSGKFKVLDELLPKFHANNQRVLIFSQFTMILDIIEEYLVIQNYTFLRLDGQTKVSDRLSLIDQFTDDTNIFIFLLSTRAGGLGINLTCANVVIIHDIDFNPFNDKQAEDRCHRVGQDAPVDIYRLISENSVEEGMFKIAEDKLRLGQDIYHKNGDTQCRDDSKDLKNLLRTTLGL